MTDNLVGGIISNPFLGSEISKFIINKIYYFNKQIQSLDNLKYEKIFCRDIPEHISTNNSQFGWWNNKLSLPGQ